MRPRDCPDPPELVVRRAVVEAELRTVLRSFAEYRLQQTGRRSGVDLLLIADEPDRHEVVGRLRSALSHAPMIESDEIASGETDFESGPYWDLIDGFGAICDSEKGAWPYMGPEQRDAALDRALVTVEDLRNRLGEALTETESMGSARAPKDRS